MISASVDVTFQSHSLVINVADRDTARTISYRLSQLFPLKKRSAQITEFLEFMIAVYAADRLFKRDEHSWERRFVFCYPVTRLEVWNSMKGELQRLLFQSMGDYFELEFRQRMDPYAHVDTAQGTFSLDHQMFTSVVLLSDGLDSLCGAVSALERGEDVAFVSIVTNSRKGSRLHAIADQLRQRYPRRARFHRMHDLHIERPPRDQEQTQRSRTMLAEAAGLTVSAVYESDSIVVSENGIGILNLPIPSLQTQHESSQVLHPANLESWRRISETLIGGARIVYPNRFRTKGEMVRDLPEDMRMLIRSTISCDRPQRFDSFEPCGVCSSCRYRQVSLFAATCDQYDGPYTSRAPESAVFDPVDLMLLQARTLSDALATSDPWKSLNETYPTLRTVIDESDATARAHQMFSTIEMLRRHVDEVTSWKGHAHAA